MKLYILKHSKVLSGFYTSIMCCAAGSKEEAIVELLDGAGKYFDSCMEDHYIFSWSGATAFYGASEEELTEVAEIKLRFLEALKAELEEDLIETDKPYIQVSS